MILKYQLFMVIRDNLIERSLSDFKDGKTYTMIVTDIASRCVLIFMV